MQKVVMMEINTTKIQLDAMIYFLHSVTPLPEVNYWLQTHT
jgi:hypothetical protein